MSTAIKEISPHIEMVKSPVNFEYIKIGYSLILDFSKKIEPGNMVFCHKGRELLIRRYYPESFPTDIEIIARITASYEPPRTL